jgi:hypothetical protein
MSPRFPSREPRRAPVRARGAVIPLLVVGLAAVGTPGLFAQTSTTGALAGTVVDTEGRALDAVLLTLRREGDETEILGRSARDGTFSFPYLDPGSYALLAERLGHVPVEVSGLAVGSGSVARVRIPLRAQAQPVVDVDRLDGGAVRTGGGGRSRALLSGTLDLLPASGPGISSVALLAPFEGNRFAARGLPERETGFRLDGIPHGAGSVPAYDRTPAWGASLPLLLFAELSPTPFPGDVEGAGTAGAHLRGATRTGSARRTVELRAGATHRPLSADEASLGAEIPSVLPDLSLRLGGPIAGDTFRYALAVDVRRSAEPAFRARGSADSEVDALLAARGDPGGLGAGAFPFSHRDHFSTFGRLDWRPGGGQSVIVRGGATLDRGEAWGPGHLAPIAGSPASSMTSAWAGASYLHPFGDASALELRLGMETATSTLDPVPSGAQPYRVFLYRGGVELGPDPEAAGTFGRTGVTLAPLLHHLGARHQARAGLRISAHRNDARDRQGPGITLHAPSLGESGIRRGLLRVETGRQADASFWSPRVSFFLENRWNAAPGLGLTGGLSLDRQSLPLESLARNERWEEVSGVDVREVEEQGWALEPRIGFDWSPNGGALEMHAAFAIRRGGIDPALLLDVLGDTGAVRVDQTLGNFGNWTGGPPSAPGFDARGTRATVLAPRFDPARTRVVEAGVATMLGGRTRLALSVDHRETHFLPRVRDLNRVTGRYAVDELGRDIHGEVIQVDGVLAIRPGSDRRFGTFEVVRVVESDGWSRSLALSLSARHDFSGNHFVEATYTRSDVQDDTPVSPWGAPLIVRARGGGGEADPTWLEGPSDLNRPDNLRLLGTLAVPGVPRAQLGLLYVVESGVPFTPTVRDLLGGEDGRGRYAAEPIALPSSLSSVVAPLEAAWPCLRDLRSGARQRNACRTDAVHRLDLRLTLEIPSFGAGHWALQLDAHDLLEGARGLPDPALLLVDGSEPFTLDPGTGELRLPLVLNPGFGASLQGPLPGRSFRVGATVRF